MKKLPPDPDGMNDDRALWAEGALAYFRATTGAETEDDIADLLANLHHACDRRGLDFNHELARAEAHYQPETAA